MTLRVRHRLLQKQGCASSLASSTNVRRGSWCHVIQLRGSTAARFTAQPCTARLEDTMVASEALRNQVASKWKDSFNVSTPGQWVMLSSWSSGRCAVQCCLFLDGTVRSKVRAGLGPFLPSSYTRGIWGHHQWISVPICVGSYVCIRQTLVMVADTHELRSAFDVLMQCRMLLMLLESFVGAFLSPYLERVQI